MLISAVPCIRNLRNTIKHLTLLSYSNKAYTSKQSIWRLSVWLINWCTTAPSAMLYC